MQATCFGRIEMSEGQIEMKGFTCDSWLPEMSTYVMYLIFITWCQHMKYWKIHKARQMEDFSVVDWFCLFVDLWVLPFPLADCSVFGNFVNTLI